MNTMTNLLKDHRVGLWCKRAAWVVLALGILQIAANLYYDIQRLPGEPALLLISVLSTLTYIVIYFFILYAVGTIVDQVILRSLQERQQTPPRPSYSPQPPPYQQNPQQPYFPPSGEKR